MLPTAPITSKPCRRKRIGTITVGKRAGSIRQSFPQLRNVFLLPYSILICGSSLFLSRFFFLRFLNSISLQTLHDFGRKLYSRVTFYQL